MIKGILRNRSLPGPACVIIEDVRLFLCSVWVLLAAGLNSPAEAPRKPQQWDACFEVEGMDGGCSAAPKHRRFEEYLQPGEWVNDPRDGFSYEFEWYIRTPERRAKLSAVWFDVGMLDTILIRQVRYTDGNGPIADLILAEHANGLISPLMK